MAQPTVLVDYDGAVALVTLNRPEQHNALTVAMKEDLLLALTTVAENPATRAVVFTGAGKSFCVGQDLGEHAESLREDATTAFATVDRHYSPIVRLLALMPKPVVAAVNGTCVGAGLGFALATDFQVWSSAAVLGTAFAGIGLTCDSGLSITLPRAVGESRARELVLSGRSFSAQEASAWGVAGDVVDPEHVLSTALDLGGRLAAGPTFAYAESKALISSSSTLSLVEALEAEATAQSRCGLTNDHAGAVSAFMSKQRPTFVGS